MKTSSMRIETSAPPKAVRPGTTIAISGVAGFLLGLFAFAPVGAFHLWARAREPNQAARRDLAWRIWLATLAGAIASGAVGLFVEPF